VEVRIEPEPDEEEREALLEALARAGLREPPEPPAYRSPWRQAALREATRP
jgi:hypothetical protein